MMSTYARNTWRHEINLTVKQKFCASSWLITEINKTILHVSAILYEGIAYKNYFVSVHFVTLLFYIYIYIQILH